MTPLYDVMSIEPYYAAKQVTKNEMKMAMCFGRDRHYKIDTISQRHFEEAAAMADLPSNAVRLITEEIQDAWSSARETALKSVGSDFAPKITGPIIAGFEKRLKQLIAR